MTESLLLPTLLCFLRISAFVGFLPPFGGQQIPNLVRIGVVLALTLFWLPQVIPFHAGSQPPDETTVSVNPARPEPSAAQPAVRVHSGQNRWLLWTWLAVREVMLGAGLGWLLGMILIPMRIAGSWLAEQIGLDIASIATGTDTGSGNVLGVILESLGVLLLYSLSVHHDFLRVFDRFFATFQVGQFWQFPESNWVIGLLTRLPERGLVIAAPLAVMLIMILVVLMFAMKQSPQFNLFTFGMPFRLAAGLIAMVVMFPDVLAGVTHHLQTFLVSPS